MKLLSRLARGSAAAVFALSSLVPLATVGIAHAAVQTCTWTGTAGDKKFSTAANWSNCGSAAPKDGDLLTFDKTALTTSATILSDQAGVSYGGITFSGTNSNNAYYSIGGPISVSGSLEGVEFVGDVTLTGPATLKDVEFTKDSTLSMGANNITVNTGYALILSKTLSGSGSFTVGGAGVTLNIGDLSVAPNVSSWTGKITVTQGSLGLQAVPLSSTNSITIASGASINLCGYNGASMPAPLTIGGKGQVWAGTDFGAIVTLPNCYYGAAGGAGLETSASIKWTGPVTLTADTLVGGSGELTLSGTLSGSYKLTMRAGDAGKLTIASTNNTTNTTNGTVVSATANVEYKDTTGTQDIFVGGNSSGVLIGKYREATIMNTGILKGTGVLLGLADIATGGVVAPGMSPGCITSDRLTLAGEYQFELGGTVACESYDQLKVLNAANVDPAVTLDDKTSVLTTSRYKDFTPKQGDTFVIIDQAGDKAVKGTFKGLVEGATFTQNGITFKISYKGGDGNDVTLTVMNQPTAPDTGFSFVSANPVVTLTAVAGIAAGLFAISRKLQTASVKTRR